MRVLFLLVLLLGISACKKNVELSQPYYDQKVVVDGYIETGNYARVYLTLSSPYLTHYDSASIRKSFLNYAKITLTSSTGEEEIMTLFRENSFSPIRIQNHFNTRSQRRGIPPKSRDLRPGNNLFNNHSSTSTNSRGTL